MGRNRTMQRRYWSGGGPIEGMLLNHDHPRARISVLHHPSSGKGKSGVKSRFIYHPRSKINQVCPREDVDVGFIVESVCVKQ